MFQIVTVTLRRFRNETTSVLFAVIKTLVSVFHIAYCMQMIAISSNACYQILSRAYILMYYLFMNKLLFKLNLSNDSLGFGKKIKPRTRLCLCVCLGGGGGKRISPHPIKSKKK